MADKVDKRVVRGQRIVERMDSMGISGQDELAEIIGCSQGAISQLITGMTNRSRLINDIADAMAVNVAWLNGDTDELIEMYDENGERIHEADLVRRAMNQQGVASTQSEYKATAVTMPSAAQAAEQLGSVLIPQLEIGYSMGGGSVFADYQQTAMVPFPREWLRSLIKGRFDELFVARGEGDSMTPTLLDGDLVIVDTAQKNITQQDRLWCLSYGDLGMIKRVRVLPDGGVQINSDNPNVTPIRAYDGELHVVGRVIWIGRRV